MPFAGHVPVAVGIAGALRLNMATIDHLDGYFASMLPADSDDGAGGYGGFFDVMLADEIDSEAVARSAAATAAAGTWNVPTEVLVESVHRRHAGGRVAGRDTGMAYVPRGDSAALVRSAPRRRSRKGASTPRRRRERDRVASPADSRSCHRAGAGLLLGSDAPQIFNVPGFSLHRELAVLVDAGLSPYQALRTGTANVAEFLGLDTGIVAVGRAADLVLLDANPLEDIANSRRIHGVMVRGTWYARGDLDRRLSRYVEPRD